MAKVTQIPPKPQECTYVAELSQREVTIIHEALRSYKYIDRHQTKPPKIFDEIEKIELQFLKFQ